VNRYATDPGRSQQSNRQRSQNPTAQFNQTGNRQSKQRGRGSR